MPNWNDFYNIVVSDIEGDFVIQKQEDKSVHLLFDLNGKTFTWIMDNDAEVLADNAVYREARGDVLIAGLGIGYEHYMLANTEGVNSITTVEKESSVITLVSNYLSSPKLSIVNDRILNYLQTTDKKFDVVYFDVFLQDPIFYQEEVRILTEAAQRVLNDGGRVLFWKQYRPLEL